MTASLYTERRTNDNKTKRGGRQARHPSRPTQIKCPGSGTKGRAHRAISFRQCEKSNQALVLSRKECLANKKDWPRAATVQTRYAKVFERCRPLTTTNRNGGIDLAAFRFHFLIDIPVGIGAAALGFWASCIGGVAVLRFWAACIRGVAVESLSDVHAPRSDYRAPCPRAYGRIRIGPVMRVKRGRPP
jgi:hypothetical protein